MDTTTKTLADVAGIESLRIESIRQAFSRRVDMPEIWQPQTRETADHSLPLHRGNGAAKKLLAAAGDLENL